MTSETLYPLAVHCSFVTSTGKSEDFEPVLLPLRFAAPTDPICASSFRERNRRALPFPSGSIGSLRAPLSTRSAAGATEMRKRERENPCGICGHYHKYEEGEVCGVCGHRPPAAAVGARPHDSAFPSEILAEFLFLGSYDNASRSELLKTIGVSHILNVSLAAAPRVALSTA
jgi:hypothetical protein